MSSSVLQRSSSLFSRNVLKAQQSRSISTRHTLKNAPTTKNIGQFIRYERTRSNQGPLMLVPNACYSTSLKCLGVRKGFGHQARGYASGPGGNGFPGISFGPQHQKGDALKEYVSNLLLAREMTGRG